MNNSERYLTAIKEYFLQPFGWILSATTLLIYAFSTFGLINIENLIDFRQLIIITVCLFTYSLSTYVLKLTPRQQHIVSSISVGFLLISLIGLCYTYLKMTEWSRFTEIVSFDSSRKVNSILLGITYISAFLFISISYSKKEFERGIHVQQIYSGTSPVRMVFYSITLLAVFLIGMGLRMNQLYSLSFWVDETTTILVAQQVIDGQGQFLLSGKEYGRANVYHAYLAWFMEKFSFLGLNVSTRLANTPFFIITFLGILLIAKRIHNIRAGLIAVALFSFSWIPISMFREARFYDIFSAMFVLLCASLIYLDNLFYQNNVWKKSIAEVIKFSTNSKFILGFISACLFAWLCFNSQPFVVLILYPLFLFGILVLVLKKDPAGIPIALMCVMITLLALVYLYPDSFSYSYLIYAPQPEWKTLLPDAPFSEFWNFLIKFQFGYLPAVVALVIPLMFYAFNRKHIFLLSVIIGWYTIMAFQGYNSDAIRYYYPILPFVVIIVAIVFEMYLSKMNRILPRLVFSGIIIFIIGATFYGGWIESSSVEKKNSLNKVKNSSHDQAIDYLISTGTYGISKVLTDNTFSMIYYLTFGTPPDYVVIDNDLVTFQKNNIDSYVGSRQIDYRDITNIKRPIYYAFVNSGSKITPKLIPFLKSIGGVEVYSKDYRLIYYFPKEATTTEELQLPE